MDDGVAYIHVVHVLNREYSEYELAIVFRLMGVIIHYHINTEVIFLTSSNGTDQ